MKAYIIFKGYAGNVRGMELLRSVADEVVVRSEADRPGAEELKRLVADYDVLVIGPKEKMTAEVYAAATRLKYLCTSSIGLDHIDRKFLESSSKIKVINLHMANVVSVAEFVLAYIMSDIKFFGAGHRAFADGTDRAGMPSLPRELSSMTIGLIGAGKIATKFVELAASFGPKLLCWTFNPAKHAKLTGGGALNLQNF